MWETMKSHIRLVITSLAKTNDIILVSGGAAGADHLAVDLWLRGISNRLELHLPAEFKNSHFIQTQTKSDAGRAAEYYHQVFENKTAIASTREIQKAIDKGATVTVSPGFHARNLLVGNVDLLVAYTFGTSTCLVKQQDPGWKNHVLAGLKNGGTAHTWDNSNAPVKLHTNLQDWC
jgi:hypothetical protein